MHTQKHLHRSIILPLEQLSVGDYFHFAYRVIDSRQNEHTPNWIVIQISGDFYKVRLTQQFIVAQANEPGSIEMKVPKSTMVARCDKMAMSAET